MVSYRPELGFKLGRHTLGAVKQQSLACRGGGRDIVSRVVQKASRDGWTALPGRLVLAIFRRVTDRLWAGRLRCPGFRAARSPRILGRGNIHLGADFHARDFLWLEAVLAYSEGGTVARFSPSLHIGSSARLSDNVHIACIKGVSIGNHLLCGSGVLITDHAHGSYRGVSASDPAVPPAQRPLVSAGPVVIGNNVWLGDGVAVLAGAVIGDGCVIGAHAVVTGTIPPGTIAVGSPARAIRRWSPEERAWLPIPDANAAERLS